jgi:hypothetical protein
VTAVNVNLVVGATCHYWIAPEASESVSGLGVTVPDIVHGWIGENPDGSSATLTVQLDNSYTWDVNLEFRDAPPVYFDGFEPGNGGDLLTLLTAQGWVQL